MSRSAGRAGGRRRRTGASAGKRSRPRLRAVRAGSRCESGQRVSAQSAAGARSSAVRRLTSGAAPGPVGGGGLARGCGLRLVGTDRSCARERLVPRAPGERRLARARAATLDAACSTRPCTTATSSAAPATCRVRSSPTRARPKRSAIRCSERRSPCMRRVALLARPGRVAAQLGRLLFVALADSPRRRSRPESVCWRRRPSAAIRGRSSCRSARSWSVCGAKAALPWPERARCALAILTKVTALWAPAAVVVWLCDRQSERHRLPSRLRSSRRSPRDSRRARPRRAAASRRTCSASRARASRASTQCSSTRPASCSTQAHGNATASGRARSARGRESRHGSSNGRPSCIT